MAANSIVHLGVWYCPDLVHPCFLTTACSIVARWITVWCWLLATVGDIGTAYCGVGSQRFVSGLTVPLASTSGTQSTWLFQQQHQDFSQAKIEAVSRANTFNLFPFRGGLPILYWPGVHDFPWQTDIADTRGVGSLTLTGRWYKRDFWVDFWTRSSPDGVGGPFWLADHLFILLAEVHRGGLPLSSHWPRTAPRAQSRLQTTIKGISVTGVGSLLSDWPKRHRVKFFFFFAVD